MLIDAVNLEVTRIGEQATLTCKGRPFGLSMRITLPELEQLVAQFTQEATTWRHEQHTAPVDYYVVLGVTPDATGREITNAYRRLAKRQHPDVSGDTVTMQHLNEAYAMLSDPGKRQQYDQITS